MPSFLTVYLLVSFPVAFQRKFASAPATLTENESANADVSERGRESKAVLQTESGGDPRTRPLPSSSSSSSPNGKGPLWGNVLGKKFACSSHLTRGQWLAGLDDPQNRSSGRAFLLHNMDEIRRKARGPPTTYSTRLQLNRPS